MILLFCYNKLFLVNEYQRILNRQPSFGNILQQTVEELSCAFQRLNRNPENLIYELFKIHNKDEASIGKLIMV